MITVSRQVEMTIQIRRGPLALGHLLATLNSCGAEVLVAHSHATREGTTVRLVTNDAARTTRALAGTSWAVATESVVLMGLPDKPGLMAGLGAKLTAAGIQVLYSYEFRAENEQLFAVFKTDDDTRAVYLLEVDALIHDVAAAMSWQSPAPVELAPA